MRKLITLALACLALAACGTVQFEGKDVPSAKAALDKVNADINAANAKASDVFQGTKERLVADLQRALAKARQTSPFLPKGDEVAANCYAALLPLVGDVNTTVAPVAGAFSALENVRYARLEVQNGGEAIPVAVKAWCGELWRQEKGVALGFVRKVGNFAGISIPGLPTIPLAGG